MADEKFKLPRSSYEEVVKIIKAYGHFQEPANLEQVSKLVGIATNNISANSAFLMQTEILDPGSKKQLTEKGRELARALEHEMPNEIREGWRKVVSECSFLTNLVSSVRIRKAMDESTLLSHIAYSAGEAKKPYVMTGARTVVDILRGAEVLQESEGKFVEGSGASTELKLTNQKQSGEPSPAEFAQPRFPVATTSFPVGDSASSASICINIEVNVSCKFEELSDLGEKLKHVIHSLREPQSSDESPDSND